MSHPESKSSCSSKAKTFLTFAAGSVITILGTALLIEYCLGKSREHLARLAAGESDYERHHPHGD